jgi:hypothetical protein
MPRPRTALPLHDAVEAYVHDHELQLVGWLRPAPTEIRVIVRRDDQVGDEIRVSFQPPGPLWSETLDDELYDRFVNELDRRISLSSVIWARGLAEPPPER